MPTPGNPTYINTTAYILQDGKVLVWGTSRRSLRIWKILSMMTNSPFCTGGIRKSRFFQGKTICATSELSSIGVILSEIAMGDFQGKVSLHIALCAQRSVCNDTVYWRWNGKILEITNHNGNRLTLRSYMKRCLSL